MRLTDKARDFIQYYDGDDVKCMRLAGYEGADIYLQKKAEELLKNPIVQKALQDRDKYYESRTQIVADRQERQAWWTSIMRNKDPDAVPEYDGNGLPKSTNVPLPTRLKASEMLGKSEGDFIERHIHEGNITITDIIRQSYSLDDPAEDVEAIEAAYREIKNKKELIEEITPVETPNTPTGSTGETELDIATFL